MWEPLTEDETSGSVGTAAPGTLSHRAVEDGILTTGGHLVLLTGTRLVMLEGLGLAIWLLLDIPRTPAQIVEVLAEEGPVPDGAEDLVSEAMDALVTAGPTLVG